MIPIVVAAIVCNAHPAFAIKPVVTNRRVARQGDRYIETARLRFTLVRRTTESIPSNDAGLRAHAAGHATVARRVSASSGGAVQSSGLSRTQAESRMNRTIMRLTSDLNAELLREEQAYDTITADGAAQAQGPAFGFPGGPNARAPCPRSR